MRTKVRNPFSTHAKGRKAGPMKDRRTPRGGTRNEQRELLDEHEEDVRWGLQR